MNDRIRNNAVSTTPIDAACNWSGDFDVVVIGGGAAGIGVTASLLRRQPSLRIAIIEPGDRHYYQPAWTLVGGRRVRHRKNGAADGQRHSARSYLDPGYSEWL